MLNSERAVMIEEQQNALEALRTASSVLGLTFDDFFLLSRVLFESLQTGKKPARLRGFKTKTALQLKTMKKSIDNVTNELEYMIVGYGMGTRPGVKILGFKKPEDLSDERIGRIIQQIKVNSSYLYEWVRPEYSEEVAM